MSVLILAAALAASPPAERPHQAECRDLRPIQAAAPRQPAGRPPGLKLGEQPPADLYRTVLRRQGACDVVEVFIDGRWTHLPAGPLPAPRPAHRGW